MKQNDAKAIRNSNMREQMQKNAEYEKTKQTLLGLFIMSTSAV